MNSIWIFVFGIALTITFALLAIGYLQPHLKKILIDLCGTTERAAFWTAFSNVTLLATPLIFALHSRPSGGERTVLVYALSDQIEWALLGFLAATILLGFVLGLFIPREKPAAHAVRTESRT